MGYQVGNQCFDSEISAQNHVMTQVIPVPTSGGLLKPSLTSSGWLYQGQPVSLVFPHCSPSNNFYSGSELGWALVGIMVIPWVFRIIGRLISDV